MRPQEIYPEIGDLVRAASDGADRVALLRATCETWDVDQLRVDPGSPWTGTETQAALLGDLAGAEEALRSAIGRLEGAWSALGRLAID